MTRVNAVLAWINEHVFDHFHHWAAVWAVILLTWAVHRVFSDKVPSFAAGYVGTVMVALVGLVTTLVTAPGLVHGWKATMQTKYQAANAAAGRTEDPAPPAPKPVEAVGFRSGKAEE